MGDSESAVMKMLLLDTCGEFSRVGLSAGEDVVASLTLPRGGGSAGIVDAIGELLREQGTELRHLDAVGVVSGPGSFTGVRVGLATAKGLCEATGVKMIAVSRLAVLADAVTMQNMLAVIDAGRGELYLGEMTAEGVWREWLESPDEVLASCVGRELVTAEAKVADMLAGAKPVLHEIEIEDVVRTVLRALKAGVADMTLMDANYVRRESDIYAKPAAVR